VFLSKLDISEIEILIVCNRDRVEHKLTDLK